MLGNQVHWMNKEMDKMIVSHKNIAAAVGRRCLVSEEAYLRVRAWALLWVQQGMDTPSH